MAVTLSASMDGTGADSMLEDRSADILRHELVDKDRMARRARLAGYIAEVFHNHRTSSDPPCSEDALTLDLDDHT
jgi:hypothetical protein